MSTDKAIKKLRKYGEVKTCKIVMDKVVTIVLGKGFSTNATTTFDFINDCTTLFPEFKVVETMITDEDLAIVVLIKPDKK